MTPPRPNVRRITKLDAFEQAMRTDPNYDGQGKTCDQETYDATRMLAIVGLGILIALLLFAGALLWMIFRPLSIGQNGLP